MLLVTLSDLGNDPIKEIVVFRGVLDQDGAAEVPLHPGSHAHEVPPQVSHPEELGLEGERTNWSVPTDFINCRATLSVSSPPDFSTGRSPTLSPTSQLTRASSGNKPVNIRPTDSDYTFQAELRATTW